ncbi:MAG: hypothetical protein M1816_005828 [Peltula sp. TS41687]|nr:MAG: hypothetical protein M1816_005828 [Peltula sp. TS41687]
MDLESCPARVVDYPSKNANHDSEDQSKTTAVPFPEGSIVSTSSRSSTISEKLPAPPQQNAGPIQRFLRHRLFSIYRRLFSIVFITNLVVLVVILMRSHSARWPQIMDVGTACSANLAVAILMRQEHIVNVLFALFCSLPLRTPLFIRRLSAKVYHLGGLHSGCAVAAFVWFILLAATITREYVTGSQRQMVNEPAVLVVTYMILSLLWGIIVLALPRFRSLYHNSFEAMHRFGGWSTLVLLWLHVILLSDATRKITPGVSLGTAVSTNPSFWLLVVATCSIIYPWLRLRRVEVNSEVLSDHAIRLDFAYKTAGIGSAVRLSDRPLKEWHAFAAFSKPNCSGFSVVVSNAGDWTRKQISKPPNKLWVRGIPTSGVLRVATLFKKVVLVTTGSGIGPCLSVIYSGSTPCRVLWSTPHPLETFGKEIISAVKQADPEAIIHNTRTMGKPDMVALTHMLYTESGAEAVVVISNSTLTKQVVYEMESRGVPAYGPIWDS